MSNNIKVFVSYSRRDEKYLQEDSLMGYLKGLEKEGIEFWTDRQLSIGELWDDEIKQRIADTHIALVLVSQAFLNTEYCQNIEINGFLAQECHIFPIILSACGWKRHDWLSNRQFLPDRNQTIEEHYTNLGKRKRLFLEIRQQLHNRAEIIRAELYQQGKQPLPPNPFTETGPIQDAAKFIGRKAELQRLNTMLQGGSVSLLGEAKIGKSSLLWHLRDHWQGEVIGPINLHGVEDKEDFNDQLAQTLKIPESSSWRNIRENLRKRESLLLFDELDTGFEYEVSDIELGRFRAICQANRKLKLVVTSRRPLSEIFTTSKNSNPYDFLTPHELKLLSEAEARNYLSHPWSPTAPNFDQDIIDLILSETKNHPFKLQQAAFHCYESLGDSAYDWQTLWKQNLSLML